MERFFRRYKGLFALLVVACSFIFAWEWAQAQAQGPIIARVVFYRNQVRVERGTARPSLAINMPIYRGDKIITGPNSRMSIRMEETRSEILIDQNSNYELKEPDRHRLNTGDVLAKVKRTGRAQFVLESPTAVASVSGTTVTFSMFGVTFTVTVTESTAPAGQPAVQVQSGGVTVTVNVGQTTTAVGNNPPAPPAPAPPALLDEVDEADAALEEDKQEETQALQPPPPTPEPTPAGPTPTPAPTPTPTPTTGDVKIKVEF